MAQILKPFSISGSQYSFLPQGEYHSESYSVKVLSIGILFNYDSTGEITVSTSMGGTITNGEMID